MVDPHGEEWIMTVGCIGTCFGNCPYNRGIIYIFPLRNYGGVGLYGTNGALVAILLLLFKDNYQKNSFHRALFEAVVEVLLIQPLNFIIEP